MTTTHTPGPWRICYSDRVGGGNIRSDHHRDGEGALLLEAGSMFHDYIPDKGEILANLRLAAAAPELLAALEKLISLIEINESNCSQCSGGDLEPNMSRSEFLSKLKDDSEISASDCLWRDGVVLNAEAAIAQASEVNV